MCFNLFLSLFDDSWQTMTLDDFLKDLRIGPLNETPRIIFGINVSQQFLHLPGGSIYRLCRNQSFKVWVPDLIFLHKR